MLDISNIALVIVDVQGKLAQLMDDKSNLFANLQRMVKGAQAIQLPILWVEQLPEKLGPTIPELQSLLHDQSPIRKETFSSVGNRQFMQALAATGRKQLLITGIEAHICVYQTAVELAAGGYKVEVVTDAVGSRVASNKAVALKKMAACGVALTSTEMALFELLRTAAHESFREIQAAIK